MMKYLIVNADDFNLTRGVDRAILDCHDDGIVTSTTVLMTLPFSKSTARELLARPFLGTGIHLSLTLGRAVHPQTPFALSRHVLAVAHQIPSRVAEREYEAQILKFQKLLKRMPTHWDSHHHIHCLANLFSAVRRLSLKYKIPFRQFRGLDGKTRQFFRHRKNFLTHHLYEDLDSKRPWTEERFEHCLGQLPNGISEMMVHPGYLTRALRNISSFREGREAERRILMCPQIRKLIEKLNIKLIHFGDLKYFGPLFD
ncbi:MAG: ChbG/HpnK family deacetylase [Candidatus Omnitrophica bacterium]|nr:ChbG/HpnK family deacetylase [Candidatus Omnitrophota bacterium]